MALGVTALLVAACAGVGGTAGHDTGGGGGSAGSSASRLQVTATLPLIGEFVREVGGQHVEVATILEPGDNPHGFQPSPTDARKIADAAVIVQNGLGLESWLSDLVASAKDESATVVALSEGLDRTGEHAGEQNGGHGEEHARGRGREDAHDHAGENPHVWLAVPNAQRYVEIIRGVLTEADPGNAETYRVNAKRYHTRLGELDSYIRQQTASIPTGNRKLVTFHDAFPHFAETYGYRLVGVVLENPNEKPSSGQVADLVRAIRNEKVPAVFTEPQFASSLADTIAAEANVEVHTLYATLAEKGGVVEDDVSTYTKMMRTNIDHVVAGLS